MYDAITIDTQVVETNSFDFDGGLLAQLKQFKNGPIKVVISNVVESELLGHLKEKIVQTKDAVETAHKKALLYGLKPKGDTAFQQEIDAEALAEKRLADYFEAIGAQIVTNDVSAQTVLHSYFHGKPPFSTAKKKSEFPDAIALMSLEAWAEANSSEVIAVSGDKDWLCYSSTRITVVSTLIDALAKLQSNVARAKELVDTTLEDVQARGVNFDTMFAEAERQVGSFDIMAEAESGSLRFEDEGTSLTLTGLDISGDGDVQIVQVGPSKIVASLDLFLTVDSETSFGMNAWDSIDKDEVYLGSMSASKENIEFEVGALVTLEGDLDSGELEITDVDILTKSHTIYYGELEPDFRDESETDDPGDEDSEESDEGGPPPDGDNEPF